MIALPKRAQLFILAKGDGDRAAVFSTFHKASPIGTFQAAPGSVVELDREKTALEIDRIRRANGA